MSAEPRTQTTNTANLQRRIHGRLLEISYTGVVLTTTVLHSFLKRGPNTFLKSKSLHRPPPSSLGHLHTMPALNLWCDLELEARHQPAAHPRQRDTYYTPTPRYKKKKHKVLAQYSNYRTAVSPLPANTWCMHLQERGQESTQATNIHHQGGGGTAGFT